MKFVVGKNAKFIVGVDTAMTRARNVQFIESANAMFIVGAHSQTSSGQIAESVVDEPVKHIAVTFSPNAKA